MAVVVALAAACVDTAVVVGSGGADVVAFAANAVLAFAVP